MGKLSDQLENRFPLQLKKTVPKNFPFLISHTILTSAFFARAQNGGGDIRVSKDVSGVSGIPLDVEVFNNGTKKANLWLKHNVTLVSGTTIYLWCNPRSGAMSQPSVASSIGLRKVWTSAQHASHNFSTELAGKVTLNRVGTTSVSGPNSSLLRARQFGTSTTDRVSTNYVGHPPIISRSVWVRLDGDGGGGFGRVWSKGTGSQGNDHFFKRSGVNRYTWQYQNSYQSPRNDPSWWVSSKPTGHWFLLGVVHNRAALNDPIIYFNGVKQTFVADSTPAGTFTSIGNVFMWGNRVNFDRNFNGRMAEPRYYLTSLTSAWFALEHLNQSNQTAFASLGIVTSIPAGAVVFKGLYRNLGVVI